MLLNKRHHLLIKLLFASVLLLVHSYALSLPEDSQKPIHITSNSAIKDQQRGLTIYEGNVDIKQGTLNIKADKVTIYIVEEEVTRIIAEGKPASFKQKPEPNKGDVLAKADTIKYQLSQKKVTLINNASIDQDGSVFTSNKIDYYIEGARAEGQGNVNVVLQPQKDKP